MEKILLLGGNGYIGSAFYERCKSIHDITSIDICLFGNDLQYSKKINFNNLDIECLHQFDTIICLAAHSSVQMAECNFHRSWANNVEYFKNLCDKISLDQKLIYASSASVYGKSPAMCREDSPINLNTINNYDLQKITIDLVANRYISLGKNIIGLRFGTVNGMSPNLRIDLMLNSMVVSAINNGKITLKNPNIKRAILGINDLIEILNIIINVDIDSGQYNLSSFNGTVQEFCSKVKEIVGAEIIELPDDNNSYDFTLDNSKILNCIGYKFTDTVESLIYELKNNYTNSTLDLRSNDKDFGKYI